MSGRALHMDVSPGEARGVVTLDGRAERLLIARRGDPAVQALGAVVVGRIRAIDRAAGLAFVDLGQGPDGILNLGKEMTGVREGAAVEAQIRAQARSGKGASLKWIGPADGAPRLMREAPGLEEQLLAFAPGATIRSGPTAREVADAAEEEVLSSHFVLRAGGGVWVEQTRALTAVDVDLGAAGQAPAKRAARTANLEALTEAARVLRLKGLGGLVVFDLVGRGHDSPALLAAARTAFSPDNPGVAVGQISRFGALELTIPRRARPSLDIITGGGDGPSPSTLGLRLLRALEREALADRGGRFEAVASPAVAEAAALYLADLRAVVGARVSLRAEPGLAPAAFKVARP